MNSNKKSKVVNINWIDESERCAIISGYANYKKIPRLKELKNSKGNCYFTSGVAHGLVDFIYRVVFKLGLKDKKLFFSRGSVKRNNKPVLSSVDIYEMDWDVGTSIIIPQRLNYSKKIKLQIDDKEYSLRYMELIVLMGLLQISKENRGIKWYSTIAASIITTGWSCYYKNTPCTVLSLNS